MSEMARRLASEAARKHSDPEAACQYVLGKIGDDAELAEEARHDGVHTWIRNARSEMRESVVRMVHNGQPTQVPRANPDNVAGLRHLTVTMLETWQLYGGKRLGDATAADLAASATIRTKVAETQTARAAFERAVCNALVRRKAETVRKGFKPDELERLARQHMEVESDAA